MPTTSSLSPAPPSSSITYPYLGSHVHTDGKQIVVWFITDPSGFGVVVGRAGAVNGSPPPETFPVDNSLFPIGFTSPNVVNTYGVTPYIGTVTLTNA